MATPITATAAKTPDARRAVRWLLAGVPALALAVAAALLLRVDTDVGAPLGPDRWLQAADTDHGNAAANSQRARAMLATRPIDGRAFRLLAQNTAASQARGDALYAIAARRAPRDVATRAALADRAFAAGDIGQGIEHLDALLRVAPQLADELLGQLAPHLGDPRLREALAVRVARSPNWRPALAGALLANTDPQAAVDLLAAIARADALTPAESSTRITLLQRLHRDGDARALWLAALPAHDRAGATATVFDGGFEHPDVADGYGWRVGQAPGVAIAFESGDAVQGASALWLQFEGRAVQWLPVEQMLVLAPGAYRLTLAANNTTDSARPFALDVVCREGGRVLATLPLPAAATRPRWSTTDLTFTVPAGCDAQLLRLRHLARSLAERRVTGALGLDAVGITAQ